MKKFVSFSLVAGTLGVMALHPASVQGHFLPFPKFDPPAVYQAAGPTAASIQSTVDQYRAALGAVSNGNQPGPLVDGRRKSTGTAADRPRRLLVRRRSTCS